MTKRSEVRDERQPPVKEVKVEQQLKHCDWPENNQPWVLKKIIKKKIKILLLRQRENLNKTLKALESDRFKACKSINTTWSKKSLSVNLSQK